MEDELGKLLQEKYTSPLRLGYEVFKGTVMPTAFKDYQKPIENLMIKDDDVIVSTFPKSGTTWTQEMVWLIINDLDYEGAKTPIDFRFPFIEMPAILDFRNFMQKCGRIDVPESILDPIGVLNKWPGRRCIKTHLPWNLLPLDIQNQVRTPKIIHVLRNPKDVCVSYHYHGGTFEGYRGTLEDTYKLYLAGRYYYTPYFPNILSFWERRHLPHILVISYEEMKADLPKVIRKVAQFLDKELTQEQVDKLAKHLSFEEMKKNNAVNYEPAITFLKEHLPFASGGGFMRSGTVGSYKKDLTEDMVKTLDEWIEKNTAGTGLKF